jgi:hypothetical protein
MQQSTFKSIVHTAVLATPLNERLARSCAVVLERKARAAGQTRWFYCADQDHLDAVVSELSPGSAVSFYFDQRIQSDIYSPQIRVAISELLVRYVEVLVGVISKNEVELDVEVITWQSETVRADVHVRSRCALFMGYSPRVTTMA